MFAEAIGSKTTNSSFEIYLIEDTGTNQSQRQILISFGWKRNRF
jgi:hypothetical protein